MMNGSEIDFAGLIKIRRQRLHEAMAKQGLDGLVFLGPSNQEYTGIRQPCADAMRMYYEAVVVILPAGAAHPHVWTSWTEGVPSDFPADHMHPPLALEFDAGVDDLARAIQMALPNARRIGIDEMTGPVMARLPGKLPGVELVNAGVVTGPARLQKTAGEIACLRHAQRINEIAMYDVEAALRPGVKQNELSSIFLRRAFELGADNSIIDPVWNLTPRSFASGTMTANGDVGFPVAADDRFLREGDLILTDSGITWRGYHSDVGKTWLCSVDPKPDDGLKQCFDIWNEVIAAVYGRIRAGASCGDLVRAAAAVQKKHSLAHFYLGHGIGCDSSEPPFIGSDLGLAFDDTVELLPGMVFVLEPVVWRDGIGGYRSEEIVTVTEAGYERISSYGYWPFA